MGPGGTLRCSGPSAGPIVPQTTGGRVARGACAAPSRAPPCSTRVPARGWRLAAKRAPSKKGDAKKGGGGDDDSFDISSFLADIGDLEDAIVEEEDQIVNVWNFDAETGQLVETQEVRKVRAKKRVVNFPAFDDDEEDEDGEGGGAGPLDDEDGDADDDDANAQFGWVKTRSLKVDGRDLEETIDYLSTLSLDELDAESRAVIEEELEAKRKARPSPHMSGDKFS